jgi:cytochrome d ubiquinol oxidase subunit I
VAIGSNLSAVWILIANAWMQSPVGFTIRNGRAEMVDFGAVISQPFAIFKIIHTISSALVLASFFIMGISAYHLLKNHHKDFFSKSFRTGLGFGLIFSLVVFIVGDINGVMVAEKQPAKLAAMESLWETTDMAPIYMFTWPDPENEKNAVEIGAIPGFLSFLVKHDFNAVVQGLKDFPKDERPPVLVTSFSFKGMVGLGTVFILLTVFGWFKRKKLLENPLYLKIMIFAIPLPYLAIQLGWIVAEIGRQPWLVYGVFKTAAGASPVAVSQVAISLVAFILVYSVLGAAGFYLMFQKAKKGPELDSE